jgi:hypothetical protein
VGQKIYMCVVGHRERYGTGRNGFVLLLGGGHRSGGICGGESILITIPANHICVHFSS